MDHFFLDTQYYKNTVIDKLGHYLNIVEDLCSPQVCDGSVPGPIHHLGHATYDGDSEHFAHASKKICLFGKKILFMTVLHLVKCIKQIK